MRPRWPYGTGLLVRIGWGVADQGLSSLTNLFLGVAVARSLSAEQFGVWALVFALYLLALGVARGAATEPYVIRHTDAPAAERDDAARLATGTAASAGAAFGVACLAIAVVAARFVDAAVASALVALAVCFPGLLLQDAWRFVFFAEKRGRAAFLNDFVWAILLLGAIIFLTLTDQSSLPAYVVAWGGTATIAAAVGISQSSVMPAPSATFRWIRGHRDLVARFVAEFGIARGIAQVGLFALAGLAGLTAAGAMRAADLILGPVSVLIQTTGLTAVSEGVRVLARGTGSLFRATVVLALAMAALAAAWGGVALLIPDELGRALLGDSWESGRSILLARTIAMTAAAASAAAAIGIRATGQAAYSIRSKTAVSVLLVGALITGAAVSGLTGAVWALAFASWLGAGLWWLNWVRALADYASEASPHAR